MPAAPCFFALSSTLKKNAATCPGIVAALKLFQKIFYQLAAARGARLRELRWKNSAWLATAETIAGWNGFEIRNAGSGRSPVRKRSGYAVMNTTGTSKVLSSSLTASRPEE